MSTNLVYSQAATGMSRGGGVLLRVALDFHRQRLNYIAVSGMVPTVNFVKMKIFYSGGVSNLHVTHFQCFLGPLSNLDCTLSNYILILGDFNVPLFNAGIPGTSSALLNK